MEVMYLRSNNVFKFKVRLRYTIYIKEIWNPSKFLPNEKNLILHSESLTLSPMKISERKQIILHIYIYVYFVYFIRQAWYSASNTNKASSSATELHPLPLLICNYPNKSKPKCRITLKLLHHTQNHHVEWFAKSRWISFQITVKLFSSSSMQEHKQILKTLLEV